MYCLPISKGRTKLCVWIAFPPSLHFIFSLVVTRQFTHFKSYQNDLLLKNNILFFLYYIFLFVGSLLLFIFWRPQILRKVAGPCWKLQFLQGCYQGCMGVFFLGGGEWMDFYFFQHANYCLNQMKERSLSSLPNRNKWLKHIFIWEKKNAASICTVWFWGITLNTVVSVWNNRFFGVDGLGIGSKDPLLLEIVYHSWSKDPLLLEIVYHS